MAHFNVFNGTHAEKDFYCVFQSKLYIFTIATELILYPLVVLTGLCAHCIENKDVNSTTTSCWCCLLGTQARASVQLRIIPLRVTVGHHKPNRGSIPLHFELIYFNWKFIDFKWILFSEENINLCFCSRGLH